MKLAASHIAWAPQEEGAALEMLRGLGFSGLEIAPTRAVGEAPYARPQAAAAFAQRLRREYGLAVCSLQSIWYGQSGSLFGPEWPALLAYTKAAIDFAAAAGARNLVFGCPKNRVRPEGAKDDDALPFFRELGAYAAQRATVLALEPNPPLYETNFLNTTSQALAFAQSVQSPGIRVNLDFGTIIENGEDVALLAGRVGEINHVHISEPGLVAVQPREGHRQLAQLLRAEGYGGYVSIEMRQQPLDIVQKTAAYVAEVFG